MTTRPWNYERFAEDASVALSAEEASAWASGWNATVREFFAQLELDNVKRPLPPK